MFRILFRLFVAFLTAVAVTAIAGSVVQTQINIAAIESIGPHVPAALRASVTGQDILRFGPVMAAIAAAALLPAFAVAMIAIRVAPAWRAAIFALAGIAGLVAAFSVMGLFTPMPTLVAAVRGTAGFLGMSATGAIGGLAFALASRARTA